MAQWHIYKLIRLAWQLSLASRMIEKTGTTSRQVSFLENTPNNEMISPKLKRRACWIVSVINYLYCITIPGKVK